MYTYLIDDTLLGYRYQDSRTQHYLKVSGSL